MTSMTILLAEDKEDIRNLVSIYLQKEGYKVLAVADGQKAWDYIQVENIDLCIFDVMMPGIDGFSLVQKVRNISQVPIIMLTAKDQEEEKILGLDLGADDYITKPFSSLELVSRVKAHLRRNYSFNNQGNIINYGEITIDKEKCSVSVRGESCNLTAMEYKLLQKFVNNPERVFTKSQLYEDICGTFVEGDENTIAVHISRLRDKIELDPKHPRYIKTVRGLGYKIDRI